MANILDYIAWRGDLTFAASPFNEIDALILSQIAYLNFDGLLTVSFKDEVSLEKLSEKFKNAPDFEKRADLGALINKLSVELLYAAGKSKRFGDIKVCGYTSKIDLETEKQFAAMTFKIEKQNTLVAFRGTDDTIVGWKEDFNLAIKESVPAQKDALDYLNAAMSATTGKICVAGHSKGGNLAIYASAFASEKFRKRISAIYNNDGPGFQDATIALPQFQEIIPKINSYYPQCSIVGMIFSHAGKYTVVESDQSGLMQHDPFSWHVRATSVVALDGFDAGSVMFSRTFNTWLYELDTHKREQFIETIFNIIQATDAQTNSELENNLFANSHKIIHAMINLDSETKKGVLETVRLLFKIASKNFPQFKEPLLEEIFNADRIKNHTGA